MPNPPVSAAQTIIPDYAKVAGLIDQSLKTIVMGVGLSLVIVILIKIPTWLRNRKDPY